MRIKIDFSPSKKITHIYKLQDLCNSYVHKYLIGNNNQYHDKYSNYCITPLMRGKVKDKYISFPNGSYIIITSQDVNLIGRIMENSFNFNEIEELGMVNTNIDLVKNESFINGNNYLTTLTPILVRDENKKNITFKDLPKSDYINLLKTKITNKIKYFNPEHKINYLEIDFDINDPYNKIIPKYVRGMCNFSSQFNLKINTDKKTAELIYLLGIGLSTGSGFGTIYNSNNFNEYKVNESGF